MAPGSLSGGETGWTKLLASGMGGRSGEAGTANADGGGEVTSGSGQADIPGGDE
jgi:hypothetical protein